MAQIQPYLHFNGNCREAMTFYKDCLGGELNLMTIGDSPMASNMPAEMHQNIMHAQLKTNSLVLLASDMGEAQAVKGNMLSLLLDCTSQEEIQDLFTKLSAGGTVGHALEVTFWGATFGDLTDKYGINWMLNFDKNQ